MSNLHLVTGYAGQAHVTAADDGSFNTAIFGNGQYVLDIGSKFAASVVSNNKITIADGDLLMQGRHVRLNEGTTVDLTITNGTQGKLRNDLIVARYTKDSVSGVEQVNLVVIKGTAVDSNPADPAYTSGDIINDHVLLNDMPLYRVPLNGLTVGMPVALFSVAEVVKDGAITTDKLSSGFVLPMNKGGTGATTAEAARKALGAAPAGYGLGDVAKSISDSDIMDVLASGKSGWYRGQRITNAPEDNLGWWYFEVICDSERYSFVRAWKYDMTKFAYGRYASGTWGGWTVSEMNSAVSITKLWENASPTSSFGEQEISFEDSYDGYVILSRLSTSNSDITVMLCLNTDNTCNANSYGGYYSDIYVGRSFWPGSNKIKFAVATSKSSASTDSMIPLMIFGIKGVK